MHITARLLRFRREYAPLFQEGEYIPLRVTGSRSNHVVAFARHLHDQWCIVAVPRLCASLTRTGSLPVGEKVWGDTEIERPANVPSHGTELLTEREVPMARISDLFAILPLGVSYAGLKEGASLLCRGRPVQEQCDRRRS
jgi:(1->4)-alpha-D-glucan 1-alpha-D-glucosylmutase